MEKSQGTGVAADYEDSQGEDKEEEIEVEYVEEEDTSGNEDEEQGRKGATGTAGNQVHVNMDTSGD